MDLRERAENFIKEYIELSKKYNLILDVEMISGVQLFDMDINTRPEEFSLEEAQKAIDGYYVHLNGLVDDLMSRGDN